SDPNGKIGSLEGLAFSATSLICRPQLNVVVSSPHVARLTEPVPVLVAIRNFGAYTTAPVNMTATLPISGGVVSAAGPEWTCSGVAVAESGGTLHCSRSNTLSANETTTVTVQLS